MLSITAVLLASLLIASCGGSSSGTPIPPGPSGSAPSGLSYSSPQTYTVGQAITPVAPTVTGTVSSYVVAPQLPAGLSLDAVSGTLSGTPTAIVAQANYTVTASNSSGSATATVSIAVNDAKPALSYGSTTVALVTGSPIQELVPATSGGAVVTWTISPALPAGLQFSAANGSISGTPTAPSPAITYTISAQNSGGQSSATLTISVQAGALLELGHADSIVELASDGTNVFSQDASGHWVLWAYATGTPIATGDSLCNLFVIPPSAPPCGNGPLSDFAGGTIAIRTPTGFELRSSTDGHLAATIAAPYPNVNSGYLGWWKLASDGSYLAAGSPAGLQVWAASGQSDFSKTGNYAGAKFFAAPGEIRLVAGAAGPNVVEAIAVPAGTSTVSPAFQGTFQTWFGDGGRFLTTVSNTVLTYSSAAVQQDATALPARGINSSIGILVGWGTLWANYLNSLSIYKVGASASATATYTTGGGLLMSGAFLLAGPTGTSTGISIIDLSGTTPVKSDQVLPIAPITTFAATSPTQWLAGTGYGVLFDGASSPTTPRYLDYGAAFSIAGSASRIAVATASGRILLFDATSQALLATIQQFSGNVQLSADGTVLAAGSDIYGVGPSPDTTLSTIYSLPGESVLSQWGTAELSLCASGTTVGEISGNNSATVNPASGGTAAWTGTAAVLLLSPDGTHVAADSQTYAYGNDINAISTNFINNGALATAVTGLASGWLDNGRLLVNGYKSGAAIEFSGTLIYGPTGALLGSSPLPELRSFQPVTADSIYSPALNSILSVSTGTVIWSSGAPIRNGVGAVAGGNVLFASGARVLSLAH